MAILGFIFAMGFAVYFTLSGLFAMFIGGAFSKSAIPFGLVLTIIGVGIGYYSITNAPFSIILK